MQERIGHPAHRDDGFLLVVSPDGLRRRGSEPLRQARLPRYGRQPDLAHADDHLAGRVGTGEAAAGAFDETVERGKAYLAAGADCFYPIGLRDTATIARLVKALASPININVRAGSPSVAELEALGVARASTASAVALMAASTIRQIAEELKTSGRFDALNPAMTQADTQRLFTGT